MNVKELRDYLAQYQDDTPVCVYSKVKPALREGTIYGYVDLNSYYMKHTGDMWDENFKLYIG